MSAGWYVDRDYIGPDADPELSLPSRVGTRSESWTRAMKDDEQCVRFRLLDDDGNVYYGGYLVESEDGETAGSTLLEWGMHDAGAVALEIREGPNEPWASYMG